MTTNRFSQFVYNLATLQAIQPGVNPVNHITRITTTPTALINEFFFEKTSTIPAYFSHQAHGVTSWAALKAV
jgi:hypothetical protein